MFFGVGTDESGGGESSADVCVVGPAVKSVDTYRKGMCKIDLQGRPNQVR